MSTTAPNKTRMDYLTDYLMDRINDSESSDFTIRLANGEFAWVSPEDQEVVLVKLQPAKFVVADSA